MGAKMTGDWAKALAVTKQLKKVADDSVKEGLTKAALFAEKTAKKHLSKQDLSWTPLESKYRRYKERKGYSTNILVRTGAMFQSITSNVDAKTAFVGVKREAKDSDGNSLANIAAVHEFGSTKQGIPARPLWQPTLIETATWYRNGNSIEDIFMSKIKRYL